MEDSTVGNSSNNAGLLWLAASLSVAVLLPLLLQQSKSSRSGSSRTQQQQQHSLKPDAGGVPHLTRNTPEGRYACLPYIGQGITFMLYPPWDLLQRWNERYGGIISFPLLGTTIYSLTSGDAIKAVLQSHTACFKKDIENTMKEFLVILGTGIVTSEGMSWLQQRRRMSHPLRVDILEIIPLQTLQAVQRLMQQHLDPAASQQQLVPLGSLLRHLTLQVISGSFLSLPPEESDATLARLYLPIVDESNVRVWHSYRGYCFFLPFFWKYHWNVYRLNAYVSQLIRQRWTDRRRQSSTARREDILDKVLADYEKEYPNATVLPEYAVRQLRDEMKTFMLAGHETSAAMMTWCFYEYIHNDQLYQDVVHEAESVFAPTVDWSCCHPESSIPPPQQLARLQLAEASLREALRKYSVVPIVARRCIKDLRLNDDHVLRAGSSVMINIQGVHLDPQRWPQPMKFDPQRFLQKDKIAPMDPFAFLAFIAGPRNCLGQHLALLESKMVMGLLSSRYRFDVPCRAKDTQDWSTRDQDPRHRFMVPVIPKQEMMVSVALWRGTE